MRRVLFCRSIYPTADHITEANHHLYELEDDVLFKSMDSLMIFSRNVAPISQNVYKHHYFLTSCKLFYVGLHVVNRSRKTIKLKKKSLLKNLLLRPKIKYSLNVVTAKDVCHAETDLTGYCDEIIRLRV